MSDSLDRLTTALSDRYAIEGEIGAGGMATVYLAQDLKHKRKVAVKVLRPELAVVLGAERFVQEITTTANLQHPHILPLFDSGEADGFLYYVMPFIDGETLRDKLNRETQLSIDEAVRITCDVADALDYAHRQGVIHRDIKPENILLHDGRPMVADFGIALAVSAAAGGRMTETGLSLGTPHYMSPEQATAEKNLTARSDIYSLGCVLYEMLTGEPPHTGASAQAIVMKIVTDEVRPVVELRKSVPPHVAAATAKALEKLPADRFDSAARLAEALKNPGFRHGAEPSAIAVQRLWNPLSLALTATVVVLLLIVVGGSILNRPDSTPTIRRYALGLGGNDALSVSYGAMVALSPDGSRLAYVGVSPDGGRALWVKDRDQSRSRQLTNVTFAVQPFFSPDGERIAVTGFGEGKKSGAGLGVVSLATGVVSVITDSGVWWAGGEWTDDGWLYVQADDGTIARFSEASGQREAVTQLGAGELEHLFPDVLPGGRGVLFTIWPTSGGFEDSEVAAFDFESGRHKVLAPGGMARYSETGHLVVVRTDGSVLAAPFDVGSLEVTGPFVSLFDGVAVGDVSGFDLALSASGDLVYVAGAATAGRDRELMWVERDGTARSLDASWVALFESVAISSTGDRFVVTVGGENESTIWIKPTGSGPRTRFTFTPGTNRRPVWSPGGDSVVFISDRGGNRNVYAKQADGAGSVNLVLDLPQTVDQVSFSPDGRWIAYRAGKSGEERDIFARRLGPDSVTVIVSAMPGVDEYSPTFSPNGQYIAYVSTESGQPEIWVQRFQDGLGGKWQVSLGGGYEPVWAKGGGELFYRTVSHLVGVRVETDSTFAIVAIDSLFLTRQYLLHGLHPTYDVSLDAQRFLMIRTPSGVAELMVVEHFDQDLIERVGR